MNEDRLIPADTTLNTRIGKILGLLLKCHTCADEILGPAHFVEREPTETEGTLESLAVELDEIEKLSGQLVYRLKQVQHRL